MADAAVWISLLGNAITLLAGVLGAFIGLRRWLRKKISDPIERLEQKVDSISSKAEQALSEAQRANERLDRHLEGNANA